MVNTMGHLAFGLLFATPAWFVWRKRVAVAFVGLALVTSQLPDVDLWLARWFPAEFHHHGVTHTVLFAVLASLVVGALAAVTLTGPLDRWLGWDRLDRWSTFGFAFLAFCLGGLSHVFADMLSAPDISSPVEPLWPFLDAPISFDLIYYTAPEWNAGLLIFALALHVVAGYVDIEPLRRASERFKG